MTKTIELHCKEINKDARRFIISSANINGTWYQIKFNKTNNWTPTERGLYRLTIETENCTVEQGKEYVTADGEVKQRDDTIWVSKTIDLKKFTDDEIKALNEVKMKGIFGE